MHTLKKEEVKPKILLVSHIGFPWGGVSQRYSDLLASSLPNKVNLTFFESSPNKRSISSTGLVNVQNILGFFEVSIKYLRMLLRIRPSLVHIASAFGNSFLKNSILIIIAKFCGYKVVLAPHCSISIFIPKSWILFHWMKYVLNRCDGLIVLSSEWMAIREIAPKSKVILLKNSINLNDYLQLRRPKERPNEKVRITYLGHIGVDKGITDLIEAIRVIHKRGIKGFTVTIYGEEMRPEELNSAKALVQNLKLDSLISFSEPVFGEKKVKVFRDTDIFVLPSHHEGLPISIIEAMAAGLPVIATNVGGIPDLVVNFRNGILVPSKAPLSLAEAMISLIQDAQLRSSFGLEGRKKALENHEVERYVDRLVDFYQELIVDTAILPIHETS